MAQSSSLLSTNVRLSRWLRATLGAAASVAGVVAMSGCETPKVIHLDLQSAAPDPAKPSPSPTARSCAVFLDSVSDERPDKAYFGDSNGLPVMATGAEGWLRGGIKTSLANKPVTLIETASATEGALRLNVHVLKAYTYSMNTATQAVVVLQVNFRRGGSDLGHEIYRGQSTPFLGGLETSLNHALERALALLANDVSLRCGQA